jgi:hypothetical protein
VGGVVGCGAIVVPVDGPDVASDPAPQPASMAIIATMATFDFDGGVMSSCHVGDGVW